MPQADRRWRRLLVWDSPRVRTSHAALAALAADSRFRPSDRLRAFVGRISVDPDLLLASSSATEVPPVVVSIPRAHFSALAPAVAELCRSHNLRLFDPEEEYLLTPDGSPRPSWPRGDSTFVDDLAHALEALDSRDVSAQAVADRMPGAAMGLRVPPGTSASLPFPIPDSLGFAAADRIPLAHRTKARLAKELRLLRSSKATARRLGAAQLAGWGPNTNIDLAINEQLQLESDPFAIAQMALTLAFRRVGTPDLINNIEAVATKAAQARSPVLAQAASIGLLAATLLASSKQVLSPEFCRRARVVLDIVSRLPSEKRIAEYLAPHLEQACPDQSDAADAGN